MERQSGYFLLYFHLLMHTFSWLRNILFVGAYIYLFLTKLRFFMQFLIFGAIFLWSLLVMSPLYRGGDILLHLSPLILSVVRPISFVSVRSLRLSSRRSNTRR